MTRWVRCSLSVADPFVCQCLTSWTMLPSSHPAHRTGRAERPHPALGESVTMSPTGSYAFSPSRLNDLLHQRLQQSRCLPCCSDCYRVERTSSRADLTPAVDHHLSRRTRLLRLSSTGSINPLVWVECVKIRRPVQSRPARLSVAGRPARSSARGGYREILCVYVVHCRKIVNVFQEHRGLHNVRES